MAKQSGKEESPKILLGDDFGPATIQVNGASISVDPDGNVVVVTAGNIEARTTKGSVVAYADSVQLKAPAPEQTSATASVTKESYEIGDVLPDGWIFLGNSPRTGKAYSLEPVKGAMEGVTAWHTGEEHAVSLNARLPSEESDNTSELLDIFNKIVKGGHNDVAKLDTSGYGSGGRYWSSTQMPSSPEGARMRYFGVHRGRWPAPPYDKDQGARVRCVRDEPQLSL